MSNGKDKMPPVRPKPIDRPTPITAEFSEEVLVATNYLWEPVLLGKQYLAQRIPRGSKENLMRTRRWLEMAPSEREADPAYSKLHEDCRRVLSQLAESIAKVSQYVAEQALRKEPGAIENVEMTSRTMRENFATKLSSIVEENVQEFFSQDPAIFLRREILDLAYAVETRSQELTWRSVAGYLKSTNVSEPDLQRVHDAYWRLLPAFILGYEAKASREPAYFAPK